MGSMTSICSKWYTNSVWIPAPEGSNDSVLLELKPKKNPSILDCVARQFVESDIASIIEDIQEIMNKKCWDNLCEWLEIERQISGITKKLQFCTELQRSFILSNQPTILSQLLTLLTCKGYMKASRQSIWNMVKHLIKQGAIPSSDDMKMIHYEYCTLFANAVMLSLCVMCDV